MPFKRKFRTRKINYFEVIKTAKVVNELAKAHDLPLSHFEKKYSEVIKRRNESHLINKFSKYLIELNNKRNSILYSHYFDKKKLNEVDFQIKVLENFFDSPTLNNSFFLRLSQKKMNAAVAFLKKINFLKSKKPVSLLEMERIKKIQPKTRKKLFIPLSDISSLILSLNSKGFFAVKKEIKRLLLINSLERSAIDIYGSLNRVPKDELKLIREIPFVEVNARYWSYTFKELLTMSKRVNPAVAAEIILPGILNRARLSKHSKKFVNRLFFGKLKKARALNKLGIKATSIKKSEKEKLISKINSINKNYSFLLDRKKMVIDLVNSIGSKKLALKKINVIKETILRRNNEFSKLPKSEFKVYIRGIFDELVPSLIRLVNEIKVLKESDFKRYGLMFLP